jgi:hypothetical protein
MAMSLSRQSVTVALVAGLAVTGCRKQPSESDPASAEAVVPVATGNAEFSQPPPTPASTQAPQKRVSGGGEFTRKSLASAFTQADQALKESYDAALIAFQIGDYPRAAAELRLLARTPGLTGVQKGAVQRLLAQVLKAAPELAAADEAAVVDSLVTTADSSTALSNAGGLGSPVGSGAARPGGAEFTQKSMASAFAQADRSLKEGYDAALIAFQIGNYAQVVSDLQNLAGTPGLTAEQKQAIQQLLVQTFKEAPDLAPGHQP